MERRWMIRIMVVLMLLLQGCSMPAPPIDLIQAPEAYDAEPSEDQLRQALPDGSRILLPLSQEGSSGITFGDVDGDQAEEAIVVFEDGTMNNSLRAALLKKIDNEWKIVWETNGSGHGLDFTQFEDVNQDGVPDLVLGWVLGGGEKGLDVYAWKNNTLELLQKKGYRDHPKD
ncbi:FG-GAP repeat protein [Paenibacillus sp. 1001270B_150601_E10]|uniref:FG-GAP repeat protein n=1 Tax=Paenibacillus sp. 1001270B_150601_E10 TaxID=2787079 RepID=UPI00189CB631|nr:FG-GAP repeat protein [Paenibacillus sp. 1001270B_150601_E10]